MRQSVLDLRQFYATPLGRVARVMISRKVAEAWGDARGLDVLAYVRALYEAVCSPEVSENSHVQKMKKYLNYVGLGIEPTGQFLHQIRRVTTEADFFRVCQDFLSHDQPMPLEPFALALKEGDVLVGEHS